jgi:hypothetical protein
MESSLNVFETDNVKCRVCGGSEFRYVDCGANARRECVAADCQANHNGFNGYVANNPNVYRFLKHEAA